MRVLEMAAFLTLSGAIHVAAISLAPSETGGSAGGEGGMNDLSLQAATPTLAAMVAEWERPPEIGDTTALSTPVVPSDSARRPAPEAEILRKPTAEMPQPPAEPAAPSIDTRLPAPPIPLAQQVPNPLPRPSSTANAPPVLTAPDTAPAQRIDPMRPTTVSPPSLPEVDTEAPESRFAPTRSARPTLRPSQPKAAPVQQQTQTAQPAQKARGTSQQRSTAEAPARQAPVASGPSKAQIAQAQREWGNRITRALRRAHRPPRGSAEGTVQLAIALSPSGHVQAVSITRSSGHARLDQAAVAAVQRARFPKAPGVLTEPIYRFSQRLTVSR